jgi:tRNA-2-methylthio-N6-dimethylallyladenosine synthase
MNVYDSQRMTEVLSGEGYESTSTPDCADLILLNTCHIREKAAEKVYSELGRYKKLKDKNPKLKIGVAGCVAQAEGEEIIKRQPLVDLVVGPQSYHRLPKMLKQIKNGSKSIDTEFPVEDKFQFLPKTVSKKRSPAAFLTVQEGCDKFCAFCVVPYTRGAEVSRSPSQLIEESKFLVDNGVVEITLLGQNVNGFKYNNDGDNWSLARLIKNLSKIDGLKRIRFTTSHPNDMTEDLIKLFGDEEKLMPYLHLPIQSGSNSILKAMNRKHNVSKYCDILDRVRCVRPDIAISGDFIVGFPGEKDADFQATLDLCKYVNYAQAYSFKYSSRPGTPAYEKTDISEIEKSERLYQLQELLTKQQKSFQQDMIGNVYPVLIEKNGKTKEQMVGRSPYLQPVFLEASIEDLGKIIPVKIKACRTNSLEGVRST